MTDTTADGVLREMRSAVVAAGGARAPGETIERWLERSARRLGISYARAFNYWHRRVRRVDAVEYLTIQERARAYATRRIEDLRAELAQLEGNPIAQFHSPSLEAPQTRVLERR